MSYMKSCGTITLILTQSSGLIKTITDDKQKDVVRGQGGPWPLPEILNVNIAYVICAFVESKLIK